MFLVANFESYMFSETISWTAGFDFNLVLKCEFRLGLPQWFGFLVKTVFLHLLCSGPLGSQQFVQMFFLVGILTPTLFSKFAPGFYTELTK